MKKSSGEENAKKHFSKKEKSSILLLDTEERLKFSESPIECQYFLRGKYWRFAGGDEKDD